ncbi:MAG: hypothetical protein MMC33_008981 [Icmadophila ericetorum]|nr:hypothetical protein [Icmadophila ericetorum]
MASYSNNNAPHGRRTTFESVNPEVAVREEANNSPQGHHTVFEYVNPQAPPTERRTGFHRLLGEPNYFEKFLDRHVQRPVAATPPQLEQQRASDINGTFHGSPTSRYRPNPTHRVNSPPGRAPAPPAPAGTPAPALDPILVQTHQAVQDSIHRMWHIDPERAAPTEHLYLTQLRKIQETRRTEPAWAERLDVYLLKAIMKRLDDPPASPAPGPGRGPAAFARPPLPAPAVPTDFGGKVREPVFVHVDPFMRYGTMRIAAREREQRRIATMGGHGEDTHADAYEHPNRYAVPQGLLAPAPRAPTPAPAPEQTQTPAATPTEANFPPVNTTYHYMHTFTPEQVEELKRLADERMRQPVGDWPRQYPTYGREISDEELPDYTSQESANGSSNCSPGEGTPIDSAGSRSSEEAVHHLERVLTFIDTEEEEQARPANAAPDKRSDWDADVREEEGSGRQHRQQTGASFARLTARTPRMDPFGDEASGSGESGASDGDEETCMRGGGKYEHLSFSSSSSDEFHMRQTYEPTAAGPEPRGRPTTSRAKPMTSIDDTSPEEQPFERYYFWRRGTRTPSPPPNPPIGNLRYVKVEAGPGFSRWKLWRRDIQAPAIRWIEHPDVVAGFVDSGRSFRDIPDADKGSDDEGMATGQLRAPSGSPDSRTSGEQDEDDEDAPLFIAPGFRKTTRSADPEREAAVMGYLNARIPRRITVEERRDMEIADYERRLQAFRK